MTKKCYELRSKTMLSMVAACICIALVLGLCVMTGYSAQSDTSPASEKAESTATAPAELLPIRENPVAASGGSGASDEFYVIRADGTLIESLSGYGERDTGDGFTFNQTREVMGNVAAVYASEESAVLAVDREGTLWLVDRAVEDSWIKALLPDFTWNYVDVEPTKLLENVAMALANRHHAVILKRDGTLWVAGINQYGASWLDTEEDDDCYFHQVMDNVIWADTTYYGGYAVTANHELWVWGLSEDSVGPKKMLDGISRVCSNNTAITDDGKLLNWYYTREMTTGISSSPRTWNKPSAILDKVVRAGRGYYILEDNTIWANTAGWMNRMSFSEQLMWVKYASQGRSPFEYKWCEMTPDSAPYLELGVKDAVYAAMGKTRSVVLDKNGVLWGIYDLNREWEGNFDPFQPIRLMDGCYGAKGPVIYGMDNFKKVQEYQPGIFSDVKESDWFYENVKAAYELGLMVGDGGKFRPDDTITLAESITIAVRVRATYRGDDLNFPAMETWWQPYVYYAMATQMHKIEYMHDRYGELVGLNYNDLATRAELTYLLSMALPANELSTLNENVEFSDLEPRLSVFSMNMDNVTWMARCGVVQGKEEGVFDPHAPVTRCEAAAMLTRCVYPELRITMR